MRERIRLSTGFVRAAGYADKIRRTFFALTKGKGVSPQEVVRTTARINMRLFDIFREKNIDKADVVRVIFEFEITEDKKLSIDWSTVTVEVYKYTETIEGISPPEEVEAEAKTAVVGEWRNFEYDESIFKQLKLKAEEFKKTDYGYYLAGPDFEAEVHDKEKIRIKYTGPPDKVNEFWSDILIAAEEE